MNEVEPEAKAKPHEAQPSENVAPPLDPEYLLRMPLERATRLLEETARERGEAAASLLEPVACSANADLALLAVRALGTIRDAGAAAALQRLAASTTRPEVRKAVRRELHRLASIGIVPSGGEAPRAAERRPAALPVYKALASPIDGVGHRGVWFGFERGAGEIDLVASLLSDTEGLKDLVVSETSRTRFDRRIKALQQDPDLPWIEMPMDYCRHLLEEAHRLNAPSGTALPVDYLTWRERIGRPEVVFEQPIVYGAIHVGEVRWDPRFLDNSAKLFDLRVFSSWILDARELGELVRERAMAQQSGLVLAGMDRESRLRMTVDRATQKLFDGRRRALYKRRLEEMSYLLWKLDMGYQARLALATAVALDATGPSLTNNPFVRAMVERSLNFAVESVRGERTRSIRPGVQLELPY